MKRIHLNTARMMLQQPESVDLQAWKKDGELVRYDGCTSIRAYPENGTRLLKLKNGQIRNIRDVLIYSINNMIVFL